MSQHDYDIANQAGAAFRSDLNSALSAIVSNNSGATAPTTTYAYQWWADTTAGILKQRNAANGAWVDVLTLSNGKPVSMAGVLDGIAAGTTMLSFRNKIINGKMEIAQRGTSFAAIGNGAYSLDRWAFTNTSAAVGTVTQNADVPSGNEFQSSYRYTVTTADASIAAGDACGIQQRVEGYNVRDLIGRDFTLSFRVRSSKTGIHCVSFSNNASGVPDRSYVAEYTVNAANTWETKSVTVPGGLITAGTWDWTTGGGLRVYFSIVAGTTFQTTAGAWQTGNFTATANQVNTTLDTIGNIFAITGVQLEAGSIATPFEHRPYGAELALCLRYLPAFNSGGTTSSLPGAAQTTTTTNARATIAFSVPTRVPPTGIEVSAGTHFTFQDTAANFATSAAAVSTIRSTESCVVDFTIAGATASRTGLMFFNNATGRLLFTGCEL